MMEPETTAASLVARVAAQIVERLVQTKARPGDMLPAEAKLASQFNVSRTVVREALSFLAGRGLIAVINGRGAMVQSLSEAPLSAYFTQAVAIERLSLREIMEARKPLEVQCARLAAQRRTLDQLDAMQTLVQHMRRSVSNADRYVELDRELHRLIAEASGNLLLAHLVSALRDAINAQTHEMLYRRRNRQQLERVHALHEAIVAEIGYRNPDAAARAMDVHFSEALVFLIQRQEEQQMVRRG
ncbi:MAG: FadR family transcriptional regulator [Thermoflexales bacterium]|nr:FadR family transcriptional regulator [Thermoflexales bacterium]MCS7324891.1 FadR family transcriptional regulator [Thermoflexales bacterium]MDW8292793.1 FadR/GntR family transcriptional regulator [Anaerolineae bacterium]